MKTLKFLIVFCVITAANLLHSAEYASDALNIPPEVRAWFRNPDGSCVQCSIGLCGVQQNCPQATTLLWSEDSEGKPFPWGKAVRGGSYPSRVEAYADKRQIPVYNVTGSQTYDWMKWASKTGRLAAIGCFSAHFQTLVFYDDSPGVERPWCVNNNNSTDRIDRYTDSEFRRHHRTSGEWVVILKLPPPPVDPEFVQWW